MAEDTGHPGWNGSGDAIGVGLLPVAAHRRRVGPPVRALLVVTLTGLLGGLVAGRLPARPEVAPDPDPPPGTLVQYDYVLTLPAGWRHTGGLPQRRRTLLTPASAPNGSDLISVEQTPLGYDSAAEPDRAYRELHRQYQQARAAGGVLDDFTLSTRIAGRDVIAYHQVQPLRGAEVEWYVVFDRDLQLSVGCQHTAAGAESVATACAEVVGSLGRRPSGGRPR